MSSDEVIAWEWQVWAADNLLRDVPRSEIEERLSSEGVPAELATAMLDAIAQSPVLHAARGYVRDARRFAMVAQSRELLERLATHPDDVERRDAPSAEEFYDRYYVANRPVILRGLVSEWPAMERWQFPALVERLGDRVVTINARRESDPFFGAVRAGRTETLPLREFVARILTTAASNDFYLVGQNAALTGPLAPMLDDIAMPEGWISPVRPLPDTSLWMGPAGAITRLHHDGYSVLACQVVGRKQWYLVPPLERGLLDRVRDAHSTLDPETQPLDDVLVKRFVLEAGEALFVPPGWWHHVRALAPSISVSIKAWARPVDLAFLRLGDR